MLTLCPRVIRLLRRSPVDWSCKATTYSWLTVSSFALFLCVGSSQYTWTDYFHFISGFSFVTAVSFLFLSWVSSNTFYAGDFLVLSANPRLVKFYVLKFWLSRGRLAHSADPNTVFYVLWRRMAVRGYFNVASPEQLWSYICSQPPSTSERCPWYMGMATCILVWDLRMPVASFC